MTPQQYLEILQKAVDPLDQPLGQLVANWDESEPTAQELFSLKGPVLHETMRRLRQLLATPASSVTEISLVFSRLEQILNSREIILSRAVVVGSGVSHL